MQYIAAFVNGFMDGAREVLKLADAAWNEYIAWIDEVTKK